MSPVFGDCESATAAPCAAELYIEVVEAGRITAMRLHGELSAYTVPRAWTRVETALEHGMWSLVVDLECVPFLDSEGVGALLRAQRLINGTSGGTLLLADVPDQGRRTLEVKGLAEMLPCFPTVGAAVAFLESWTGAQ